MEPYLVIALVAGAAMYPVFSRARSRAAWSTRARGHIMARAVVGMLLGGVLALWLPRRVPEAPGSPASLVAVLVLWIVGGLLTLLGTAALAGAVLARPLQDEE
jgi:hypothetical protein